MTRRNHQQSMNAECFSDFHSNTLLSNVNGLNLSHRSDYFIFGSLHKIYGIEGIFWRFHCSGEKSHRHSHAPVEAAQH